MLRSSHIIIMIYPYIWIPVNNKMDIIILTTLKEISSSKFMYLNKSTLGIEIAFDAQVLMYLI